MEYLYCTYRLLLVFVLDLYTDGNYYQIRQVAVADSGVYECFVDNGVKPTTLAKMRVDVLCKFMCTLLCNQYMFTTVMMGFIIALSVKQQPLVLQQL